MKQHHRKCPKLQGNQNARKRNNVYRPSDHSPTLRNKMIEARSVVKISTQQLNALAHKPIRLGVFADELGGFKHNGKWSPTGYYL